MKNPSTPIINIKDTAVVWLDLDDTLIDFQANSLIALEKVYDVMHLNRYFESSLKWIDRYHHFNNLLWSDYSAARITRSYLKMERFRMPLVEAGAAIEEATELSVALDPVYLDLLAQEKRLVPGALDLLRRIRETGLPVGILSNGFVEVQHRKIESAGLKDLIDIIVLSDYIGVNKPDKRLYEHAMRVSGIPEPQRHIMIGDNPDTDIAGAINAGWRAIHFLPMENMKAADNAVSVKDLNRIILE